MKGLVFLTLDDEHSSRSLLLRLKTSLLIEFMSTGPPSFRLSPIRKLVFVELASYYLDVRPSLSKFHDLLSSAAPSLKKLVVNGSGPYIFDDADENESILSGGDLGPV